MSATPTTRKILEHLAPLLSQGGFVYSSKRECLSRPFSGGLQLVACNLVRTSRSLSIQPVIGVRFETVERIKGEAGVTPKGFESGSTTLLAAARRYAGLEGTLRGLPLDTPIEHLVALCLESIDPLASGYFERRATLGQLDELVNGTDEASALDVEPPHRCFTGAVAAWLVARPDTPHVLKRYRDQLRTYSDGFYRKDMERLVEYLQAHPELRTATQR